MKIKLIAFLAAVLSAHLCFCQSISPKQLEAEMAKGIDKALPASVRMWGYDTLAESRTSAQFSGVVVKEQYILTAAHVTIPGNTYKVMFPDGRECIARALGKIEFADDKTRPDVALMKIVSKGNWPSADMGSSAALEKFMPLMSIAYPESLDQSQPTVRFGYVTNPLVERGFIESNCMMEPGDSGGPLFDLTGRVVGLRSAIEVPENVNYDVPVDLYKKYWTGLNEPIVYHTLPENIDAIPPQQDRATRPGIPSIKDESFFVSASKIPQNACVTIISRNGDQQQSIVGTVLSLRGSKLAGKIGESLIISKSSMVGDAPVVMTGKTTPIKTTILIRDKINDLVVLRPSTKIRGGIRLIDIDTSRKLRPGIFLLSPRPDTTAVISVSGSKEFNLPRKTSVAFSGATTAHNSTPARIYFVRPNSPAAMADIRVGDVVKAVNGNPIANAGEYSNQMLNYWPGDTIVLQLDRSGISLKKTLLLQYPPDIKYNHPAENFVGGKSVRRDGFTGIYSHDAILQPSQCGGAVFDLDGHCLGINIARFSRVNSIIVPIHTIAVLIESVEGKANSLK